ncbi:hypothetical protein FJY63_14815, partial [Candidatus Sumerlaeota bacterium]|nr:hypothetical protein [Candidatus Sumerlaeota bacterium]
MRIRWPFHVAQAGDRQVSVTLMLSEQNGKRLQFQVSKRTLFAFLAICAVALVLAIVGAAHLTSRTFSRRDKVPVWFTAFEQQRELSALQD